MNLKTTFGHIFILLLVVYLNLQLTTNCYATPLLNKNSKFQYQVPIAHGTKLRDSQTLIGPKNFFTGFPAKSDDKTINAVIEIPAGQNAKWEVSETDGKMHWEIKNGKPRVVSYLPYPFNYGMVPSTLQTTGTGGDGDPIDVVVLGSALPRGLVIKTKIIGILRLKDDDERDDKLLAVPEKGPFKNIDSLDNLKSNFPGVLNIIETWFTNYKGGGRIISHGFGNRDDALKLLNGAIEGFKNSQGEK